MAPRFPVLSRVQRNRLKFTDPADTSLRQWVIGRDPLLLHPLVLAYLRVPECPLGEVLSDGRLSVRVEADGRRALPLDSVILFVERLTISNPLGLPILPLTDSLHYRESSVTIEPSLLREYREPVEEGNLRARLRLEAMDQLEPRPPDERAKRTFEVVGSERDRADSLLAAKYRVDKARIRERLAEANRERRTARRQAGALLREACEDFRRRWLDWCFDPVDRDAPFLREYQGLLHELTDLAASGRSLRVILSELVDSGGGRFSLPSWSCELPRNWKIRCPWQESPSDWGEFLLAIKYGPHTRAIKERLAVANHERQIGATWTAYREWLHKSPEALRPPGADCEDRRGALRQLSDLFGGIRIEIPSGAGSGARPSGSPVSVAK